MNKQERVLLESQRAAKDGLHANLITMTIYLIFLVTLSAAFSSSLLSLIASAIQSKLDQLVLGAHRPPRLPLHHPR